MGENQECGDDVWAIFGSDSSTSSSCGRDRGEDEDDPEQAGRPSGRVIQPSAAADRTTTNCCVHPDFQVVDHDSSPGFSRGKGLRSLKPFHVGEEILREPACIRVPNCHAATSRAQADELHLSRIRQAYDALSEATQRCVLELSTCEKHRHHHHDHNVNSSSDASISTDDLLDQKLQGIYQTNSYRLCEENGEQTMGGLFLTIARINHSCRPNTCHFWRPDINRFLLFATRDIAVGDELFLCYLPTGHDGGCQTTRDRRAFLLDGFSFHCRCEMCVEGNSLGGDDRMAEIARLHELLPELVTLGLYDEAMQAVDQSLALLKEQKLEFGAFTKDLFGYGYQLTVDHDVAEHFLKRQIVAIIESEGVGCPNAVRLEKLLKDIKDVAE